MKKLMVIAAAMALTGAAMAMTLQAAKGQIPGAVANPAKMAEIMKELSEDDQVEFLALVNAAIAEMNGSPSELAALYLAVNEAALKAHGAGNLQALLATTYATVPPEALTVLNEQLAKDLFNRSADPTKPVSDADFAALAKEAMKAIATRASDTDNAAVRTTFAMLMFVRASEGTPADLRNTLAETISDPAARDVALTEWVPTALGEQGNNASYDPMLGASDAEVTTAEAPTADTVVPLIMADNQEIVPLLADLASIAGEGDFSQATMMSVATAGLPDYSQASIQTPPTVTALEAAPWSPEVKRGEEPEEESPYTPTPTPTPEPGPYPNQRIW